MAKLGKVAIDFGTSAIKLIQIGGKPDQPKIEKIDRAQIFKSSAEEGDAFPRTAILTALKDLLSRNKIKVKKAAITLPGQAAIIRTIKIQESPPDRLPQIVRYEAEPLIPFPLAECAFGYKVIQTVKPEGGGAGTMRVLLIAVKNERINEYVDVMRELGITPELIEVSPYSSVTAFHQVSPDETGAIALVDFGDGTTDISILRGGEMEFTRAATVAGISFTQAIQSKLGVSTDEAERLKKEKVRLSAVAPTRAAAGPRPGGPGGGRPGIPQPAGTASPAGGPPPPMVPKPPMAGPPAGGPPPPMAPLPQMAPPAAGGPPPPMAPLPQTAPPAAGGPPPPMAPKPPAAPAGGPPPPMAPKPPAAPAAGGPPPPMAPKPPAAPAAGGPPPPMAPKPPGAPAAGGPPPPMAPKPPGAPAAGGPPPPMAPKPPGAPAAGGPPPPMAPKPPAAPAAGGPPPPMAPKPPAAPAAGGPPSLMGSKPAPPMAGPPTGGLMGAKPSAPAAPSGLMGSKPQPPSAGGLMGAKPAPPGGLIAPAPPPPSAAPAAPPRAGGPPPPPPSGPVVRATPPPPPPPPPSGGQEVTEAPVETADLSALVQPLAERLLAEIRRSLEYFSSQEDGVQVTKMVVTGGAAKLSGLKEFLAARLNMEIAEADVFGNAKLPGPIDDPGAYQTVYGLALRLLSPESATLNLLPSDLMQNLLESSRAVWKKYAAALGIVLLAEAGGWMWMKYSARAALVEKLTAEYEGFVQIGGRPFLIEGKPIANKAVLEQEAQVIKKKEALSVRFEAIRELETSRIDWIPLIDAIRGVIPEKTWITDQSLNLTPEGITLSLKTIEENDAGVFLKNVQASSYLEYSGSGITTTRTEDNGVNVWTWTAPLKFKSPSADGEKVE